MEQLTFDTTSADDIRKWIDRLHEPDASTLMGLYDIATEIVASQSRDLEKMEMASKASKLIRREMVRRMGYAKVGQTGEAAMPYAKGSSTSKQAAESHGGHKQKMVERVRTYIISCGLHGTTRQEAAEALGMITQTCTARFADLVKKELIFDSGRRRVTDTGRPASVMVAVEHRANTPEGESQ